MVGLQGEEIEGESDPFMIEIRIESVESWGLLLLLLGVSVRGRRAESE